MITSCYSLSESVAAGLYACAITDNLYTGQKFDTSINMYWYGSRFYDQALGRFISADPVMPGPGNPQALNRYSYGYNNPVKYIDPTGHFVMFVGGYGTNDQMDPSEWNVYIEAMDLSNEDPDKEGYGFYDWTEDGEYGPDASKSRSVDEAAPSLDKQTRAKYEKGKKDGEPIKMVGHSKGTALITEYGSQVGEGKIATNSLVNTFVILDSPLSGNVFSWGVGFTRFEDGPPVDLAGPATSPGRDRPMEMQRRMQQKGMNVNIIQVQNLNDIVASGRAFPGGTFIRPGEECRCPTTSVLMSLCKHMALYSSMRCHGMSPDVFSDSPVEEWNMVFQHAGKLLGRKSNGRSDNKCCSVHTGPRIERSCS